MASLALNSCYLFVIISKSMPGDIKSSPRSSYAVVMWNNVDSALTHDSVSICISRKPESI